MLSAVLRLILAATLLALAGCATASAPAPRPHPAAAAEPCSPEAIARDMRLAGAYVFWVREGARNRLNACQGYALTPMPAAQAPTYRCRTWCVTPEMCRTTCRPGL